MKYAILISNGHQPKIVVETAHNIYEPIATVIGSELAAIHSIVEHANKHASILKSVTQGTLSIDNE